MSTGFMHVSCSCPENDKWQNMLSTKLLKMTIINCLQNKSKNNDIQRRELRVKKDNLKESKIYWYLATGYDI